jgi:endonuclease III
MNSFTRGDVTRNPLFFIALRLLKSNCTDQWWLTINVEQALSKLLSYSKELGLDLSKPQDRFKWFLASVLFAKRISSETAKETYLYFEQEELTSPNAILQAGWDRLVEVLDSGGYTRYDFSTATNLLGIAKTLKEKYGDLERLHAESCSAKDLESRLQEFRGVGPVGVNIFLRELRGIWDKAKPRPSPMAITTAQKIGLNPIDVERYESQLVRLNLEYCKKRRSTECPLEENCPDK